MGASKIRVGFIGCGYAARGIHLPLLAEHAAKFELVACADARLEAAATLGREQGAQVHATVDGLLADEQVELVVIMTKPPATHRDLTLAALARGKHVIVEKPMAGSSQQCQEMVEAAKAAGRLLTVHHNRRWDVDFLTALHALERGAVGEPRLVRNEYVAGFRESPYDWGIHIIDQTMCLSLGRRFVEITATMAQPDRSQPLEGEGFFSARLRTEDGVIHDMGMLPGVAGNAFRPGVQTPRFMLAGTEGVLLQDWCQRPMDAFGSDVRFEPAPRSEKRWGDPAFVAAKLTIPDFYQQLHRAIREGGPAPVTGESASRSVRAWELMCESAATGRTLQIDL